MGRVFRVFRSEALPAGERPDAVEDLFGGRVLPVRLVPRADREFEVAVRHVDLTPVTVVELTATPALVLRTSRLIRQRDPEMLSVIFPLNGELAVGQSGRETAVGASTSARSRSTPADGLDRACGVSCVRGRMTAC